MGKINTFLMAIDLRQQIESTLSNGKRLYDDATILFKNNSLSSCAMLDILAYEEFNKAAKMGKYYFSKQPFRVSDMERLTDAKSHKEKVLLHAVGFGNLLKDYSSQLYNETRNFSTQVGLPFVMVPREIATMLHNGTTRYFARLHDLRKALLYSGSDHDRFDDQTLRAVCGYLYYEAIIPYYETRFNLFLFDNGIVWHRGLTPEQLTMVRENRDKIALGAINLLCRTPTYAEHYSITRDVIDSLAIE